MARHDSLNLTQEEIDRAFSSGDWGKQFPQVLTFTMASQLINTPVQTLREWRSKGYLSSCSRLVGRRVGFFRDRLIDWYFNGRRPND